MTSNPITIAGETPTDEDWPEACPSFVRNSGGGFSFVTAWEDDGTIADHVPVQQLNAMELTHAAAVARCYFLDKLDEAFEASSFSMESDDPECRAYRASAEKWARIGRKGI